MTDRQAPREGATGYTPASKKTRILEDLGEEIEEFEAPEPREGEDQSAVLCGILAQFQEMKMRMEGMELRMEQRNQARHDEL